MKLAHYIKTYLHVNHDIQRRDFNSEFMALKKGVKVSSASQLKALAPFVDENNQLLARGRLSKASLSMAPC